MASKAIEISCISFASRISAASVLNANTVSASSLCSVIFLVKSPAVSVSNIKSSSIVSMKVFIFRT